MDALPWIFSSGWASGLNGYAVVLLLGVFGRFLGADGVPPALERTDVLVAAAVLTALDLVADKIPYVDSVWDAVHTVIRPAIGAAVGALLAGQAGTLQEAAGAGIGAVSALASHAVKAGVRAAVNTSPEPASNLVVSSAEDVTVAGVVSLSVLHPWAAATVAGVLLLTGIVVVALLVGRIRRFRDRRRDRRRDRDGGVRRAGTVPPP
jgi:hypothetical protein